MEYILKPFLFYNPTHLRYFDTVKHFRIIYKGLSLSLSLSLPRPSSFFVRSEEAVIEVFLITAKLFRDSILKQ